MCTSFDITWLSTYKILKNMEKTSRINELGHQKYDKHTKINYMPTITNYGH